MADVFVSRNLCATVEGWLADIFGYLRPPLAARFSLSVKTTALYGGERAVNQARHTAGKAIEHLGRGRRSAVSCCAITGHSGSSVSCAETPVPLTSTERGARLRRLLSPSPALHFQNLGTHRSFRGEHSFEIELKINFVRACSLLVLWREACCGWATRRLCHSLQSSL